jgi:hypothetical protein
MKRTAGLIATVFSVALLGVGCGGNNGNMMGPSVVGTGSTSATFMSVTPQGGTTSVPVTSQVGLRFGAPMGVGMEQYVDLHMGDLAGPTVPLNYGWSGDRMTLTCTPLGPLSPHTTYVVHIGAGMMTQAGQQLDYTQYGPMMGGQWIMGGMMGGSHAGNPWGMMGPGWRGSNGSYGMEFPFTTA